MAVLVLGGWVAAWWLVVCVVCGRRFGPFEWLLVAVLAFGVPLLVAPLISGSRFTDGQMLAAWGGVALTIDAGWGVWRLHRRQARRTAGP